MIDKIEDFILLKEKSIMKKKTRSIIKKATTKTQRKEILRAQKSVLKNALNLLDKREVVIYEILNRYIYPGDVERDINHHLKLV